MRIRLLPLLLSIAVALAVAGGLAGCGNAWSDEPTPVPTAAVTSAATSSPTPTATPSPTATPTPTPTPGACAAPTDAGCIRAVYLGAPDDYARVADIPDGALLEPDGNGRYHVERGQQVTVVTAASLPARYAGFRLRRTPEGSPPPVSVSQLVQPGGTTYTFIVTTDEAGSTLITFDLTAAGPPLQPGLDHELGVVVTTRFLIPGLRYSHLDTTGAAVAAGSYALLTTAGDVASAIDNLDALPADGVELRIHPADASGTSRATFYDTVEVGDSFDYRTNGLDCSFRFKVTSVAPEATPRVFGIEHVQRSGGGCGGFVDDPRAARDVEFVWRVRPGFPAPGALPVLLRGEPAREGTYRIYAGSPFVVDVPAGAELTPGGYAEHRLLPALSSRPAVGAGHADRRGNGLRALHRSDDRRGVRARHRFASRPMPCSTGSWRRSGKSTEPGGRRCAASAGAVDRRSRAAYAQPTDTPKT